eukprot:4691650-Pyramimonas_sp.AAC.1
MSCTPLLALLSSWKEVLSLEIGSEWPNPMSDIAVIAMQPFTKWELERGLPSLLDTVIDLTTLPGNKKDASTLMLALPPSVP